MFSYYLMLGVRSLRRNPALTALMVLTLAIGVAASVATLTILHVMSSNPIPQKSERLFVPKFDNGPRENYNPAGEERADPQLSYTDANNLLKGGFGVRRTVLYGIAPPIEPERKDLPVISPQGIATTRDFFAMFDVPFLYGQPWSEADDKAGADVLVLSTAMAEKLYGSINPVGKRLRLKGFDYQIVGVLKPWLPVPKFYRLIGGPGAFGGEAEDILLPFAAAVRHEMGHEGSMSCSQKREPGWQGLLDSECTWLQFFFETRSGTERAELQDYLDHYAAAQRKLGRMQRNAKNELFDVMQWLEFRKVVGNDSRLSAWLAFGFLILCLVNTIGLLLAKFSVRASEVGIRRALGASRREIFQQFLTETAVVGLVGGGLGLLLAFGALALIAMQSRQLQVVAHLDWQMLIITFVMALLAALLAGLLPTWRSCQVTPAIQLKSQ